MKQLSRVSVAVVLFRVRGFVIYSSFLLCFFYSEYSKTCLKRPLKIDKTKVLIRLHVSTRVCQLLKKRYITMRLLSDSKDMLV